MLEIGSLVDGKYKILSEIGHGGMSVVYMAINEKANKTWAVKEVRKDGVLDFEAVKQGLIVEIGMLKKLKHPNLPSIIDVIENEETFLIVMDYIEGNSLSKALDEYGAQPQEYVIEWAKQLCDVLGYLHSREPAIIYRDMKPSNIMLKPDGNLTLIDFGTAREFKEKNLADTTCLGTIGYAAPEQFGGMGQTDARTDIYCLGATLYHLVTGRNPSEPPYEMKPIREINPSLSGGLERIILKCTQRNPEDRYQSTAELMYDLHNYEVIDDAYKEKQKKKLRLFLIPVIMSFIFLALGFGFNLYASKLATDTYESTFEEAVLAISYDIKVEKYHECIAIPDKSGQKDAYLGLIQTFKEDLIFSQEEADDLGKLLTEHSVALRKNITDYTEICFEIGKMFWYYYNYGDGSDNQITRAISSIEWFEKALENAPEDYTNLGMAKVYSNIGIFYRDITVAVTEASDKGKYKPLFENLQSLIETVASDENESEIVRIELLDLARGAVRQYATKFKTDGVSEEALLSMVDKIESIVQVLETTTEKTENKKSVIIKLLADTKNAVRIAYGTKKEVK